MQRRIVIALLPTTALLMGWQRPPPAAGGVRLRAAAARPILDCAHPPSKRLCDPDGPRQLSVGRLGSSIQANWRARILKKPENVSGAKPRVGPTILQGSVGEQGSQWVVLIVTPRWSMEEEAPV